MIRDQEACTAIDTIVAVEFHTLCNSDGVDRDRVAVLGLSLGGHFALRVGAWNGRPSPVAVWYGVYPESMPFVDALDAPLLIVQGPMTLRGSWRRPAPPPLGKRRSS